LALGAAINAAMMALWCSLGYAADWTSASPKRATKPPAPRVTTAPATDESSPRSSGLVPFAEDEARAAEPRKSNFQPRFKPPAVRQANHTEPVEENVEGPKLLPVPTDEANKEESQTETAATPVVASPEKPAAEAAEPASKAPAAGGARALMDQAFAKSKSAAGEADFTEVIDLCRRARGQGLPKAYDEYAHKLAGWAHNRRGEFKAKDGHEAEALADFEAAVQAGGSWRAIHNRGVSYAAAGRVDLALRDLDRAIELNPDYLNAWFNRGELKYKQGDFAAAAADYTSALKLNPKDSATLNGRGHALYRLERFGEALRDYGEAIKIDPDNPAALINRADVYSDIGQYSEAAKDYRAAIRIAPKLGRAYHSAAWFMATCPDQHYRNEKLAVEAALRAILLDGEDYRNLSTLAAAQASAGDFDEAKATQEKAIHKASKADLATAQKMMGLYKREIAFRERPRTAVKPIEEREDGKVRQATAEEIQAMGPSRWPTRQAGGMRQDPRGPAVRQSSRSAPADR
jgi:tetratricopeptide (TPR) repeat protein